jgi:hypothetical protein
MKDASSGGQAQGTAIGFPLGPFIPSQFPVPTTIFILFLA